MDMPVDPNSQEKQQQKQMEEQMKQLVSQLLTGEARSRLANIRMVKPDTASQVEMYILQLHQAGQIRDKLTDDQLKEILKAIQGSGSGPTVKYR